ncbi:MAG: hypothetical protein C0504_20010, partial [Candidatus Solibacter sp.]|nr:hypothetical protein [Candidatus Solibacter sp.]
IPSAAAPDTTAPPFDKPLAAATAALRSPRTAHLPDLPSALLLAPTLLGSPSAAAVFHLCFLASLALLAAAFARRLASLYQPDPSPNRAHLLAAVLVFASTPLALAACDARTGLAGLVALTAGLFLAFLAVRERCIRAAAASAIAFTLAVALPGSNPAFPGFLFLPFANYPAAIPLAAIAAAVLLAPYRTILALVAALHLITSWPAVTDLLAPKSLARFSPIAWSEAATPNRDAWLAAHLPGYIQARFLDEATHPAAVIATSESLPLAWTARRVLPLAPFMPMLAAAISPNSHSTRLETRRFSPLTGRTLPIPLSAPAAEIRLYFKGREVPRSPSWRVRCPEAFDSSVLTLCTAPYAEIDFSRPVSVDEIRILGHQGVSVPTLTGLRRSAIDELRRAGITHILIGGSHPLAGDLSRNTRFWAIRDSGDRADSHLYALD